MAYENKLYIKFVDDVHIKSASADQPENFQQKKKQQIIICFFVDNFRAGQQMQT